MRWTCGFPVLDILGALDKLQIRPEVEGTQRLHVAV